MRFHSLPLSLLALLPSASAQFTYPPPFNGSIADYTSGKATPTLNFSAGDSMFGGWYTPGRLSSFLVYRCTGQTKPGEELRPLNSDFDSKEGKTQPDKTWAMMPLYSGVADGFENGFSSGRNPIWLHGEFIANTKASGDLCWFELYPGHEIYYGTSRTVTVNNESEWYFATEPFTVHPARPDNLTVTWKKGSPKPDLFKNHTEAYWASFYREFPSLKPEAEESGAYSAMLQGPGWIGVFAAVLAFVL